MQCPIVNNQNYVCSLSIFLYIRNTHRIVIIIINLIPRMCNLNINVYVSYKIKRLMRDQPSVILTRMVCGILKDSFAKEITRALDTTCRIYDCRDRSRGASCLVLYSSRSRGLERYAREMVFILKCLMYLCSVDCGWQRI